MIDICIVQAQAALVYDAVTLVADTFNRMLKKKPDTFRTYMQRGKGGGDALANASRTLNCSRNAVWEQGDRIAKFARKVRDTLFAGLFRYSSLATLYAERRRDDHQQRHRQSMSQRPDVGFSSVIAAISYITADWPMVGTNEIPDSPGQIRPPARYARIWEESHLYRHYLHGY